MLSSETTFQASRNTQHGFSSFLTCTFALIGPLWDVQVGGSVDADGAIWNPGLVNTSFHPLHDKIQQDVHSLADILPVGSTCLKVWNSAPRRKSIENLKKLNPLQTQKQSNNYYKLKIPIAFKRFYKAHFHCNICVFRKGVSSRIFWTCTQIFAFRGGPI